MAEQAPANSRIDHDASDAPEALLGGGPVQQNWEQPVRGNPITYASEGDPPAGMFHGTNDDTAPFAQSVIFEMAPREAGVVATLIRGRARGTEGEVQYPGGEDEDGVVGQPASGDEKMSAHAGT